MPPTLAETLRSRQNSKQLVRGQNGVLSEESPEEIQDLAGQAGIAPPTTAIGAGAIGATPKQQDMMGTPAQKKAALNIAQQPVENTVQGALRRREVRNQATTQEQNEMNKSENLKSLGGLGDRVNDFINAQKQKMEQSQATMQVSDQGANAQGNQTDLSALKPVLQQLAADPNNMSLQMQVNQALGYDANRQISPAEIQNLYKSSIDSISAAGADAVADKLTAGDLISQGNLGYNAQQLSELLGVPVDQVSNMSVRQIHDQVNQLMSNEFSNTNQLEQQAGSVNAGQAERALAHEGAREASRVGIRSTEADVQHLEQQISNADQVQFGGQLYKVDDLLKDDNISGIISNYLNAAPGSPTRTQLEQTEPQLIHFVQKNQTLLQDAADHLQQGAQSFQQLQQSNKDAATMGGLLTPEMAADLVPGYNQLSDKSIDPNSVPVLAVAQNLNAGQKANYAATLKNLAAKFPGMTTELAGLTPQEIQELGFDDPNGKWKSFEEQEQKYQQIMNTPDEDLHGLISQVFNVGDNVDFGKEVQRSAAMSALGLAPQNHGLDLIDADHDGKLDSPADIRNRLATSQPSLKDAITGKKSVLDTQKYQSAPQIPEQSENWKYDMRLSDDPKERQRQTQAAVYERLGSDVVDGVIDANDITKAFAKNANEDYKGKHQFDYDVDASEMRYLLDHGNLDSKAKATLTDLLNRDTDKLTSSLMKSSQQIAPTEDIRSLANLIDPSKNDPKANADSITQVRNEAPGQLQKIQDALDDISKINGKTFVNMDKKVIDARVTELNEMRTSLQKALDLAHSNWGSSTVSGQRVAKEEGARMKEQADEDKRNNIRRK
jgi:hypothetical protein